MPWEALKRLLGWRTEAETAARAAFLAAHPGKRVVWTSLAACETERFVVGVFYDSGGKPPHYVFYGVPRTGLEAYRLEDDAPYRPKLWR